MIDAAALDAMPTLSKGQAESLKIETERYRVWLSRVTGRISAEELIDGRWEQLPPGRVVETPQGDVRTQE